MALAAKPLLAQDRSFERCWDRCDRHNPSPGASLLLSPPAERKIWLLCARRLAGCLANLISYVCLSLAQMRTIQNLLVSSLISSVVAAYFPKIGMAGLARWYWA